MPTLFLKATEGKSSKSISKFQVVIKGSSLGVTRSILADGYPGISVADAIAVCFSSASRTESPVTRRKSRG